MKKTLLSTLPLFLCILTLSAQTISKETSKFKSAEGSSAMNWTTNPFEDKVFVSNEGQFTADLKNGDKILYGARVDGIYAFITNHGLIYKYTEFPKSHPAKDKDIDRDADRNDPDRGPQAPPVQHYLTATWEGENNNMVTVGNEEQPDYYSYPGTNNKSAIIGHAFKTVTCKNVYPGIDVEYMFPGDDKTGIKYTIIVHPGADLSLVKLKYDGAESLIEDNGDINIDAGWGQFTDHAPVSYYEDKTAVTSAYKLTGDEESFVTSNLDRSKSLIVDPWTTNWTSVYTGGGGANGAYDLDYDNAANVYVYGGGYPYELKKYNSSGTLQWTYTTSNFLYAYYGDFCVDKASGISFALEAFNPAGVQTDKIAGSGALIASYTASSSEDEQWRCSYDICDGIILIAGGGTNLTNQAATIDTNLVTYNFANVMGLPYPPNHPYHDFALIATDPFSTTGYMGTTTSSSGDGLEDNYVIQMPLPLMLPTTYNIPDGYALSEVFSISYVSPGVGSANGMNGMACSPNWLYMYDGEKLDKRVKATGALSSSINIGGTRYAWGGIDADMCDNVYLGNGNKVYEYNSALTLLNTFTMSNTVYDVVLSRGEDSLYVSGNGFLSSISLHNVNTEVITKTRTNSACGCTGTATAQLSFCGTPYGGAANYLWSNGATTSSVTGLCPATYTVTIKVGCLFQIQDTVLIKGSAGTLTLATSQVNATCALLGSGTVIPAGGVLPYTYSWNTVPPQTNATATGLSAGCYTVTVTDNGGCSASASVCITQAVNITAATAETYPLCNGGTGSITVTPGGGAAPYTYSWAPTGGSNASATGLSVGCYTVTVTDNNGCSATASACITQPIAMTATTTVTNIPCFGGVGSILANPGGGTAPYAYSWSTVPPQTNATATGLSAGSYTVTVTDANGCVATASASVTEPTQLTATMGAPTYPLCAGGTGSVIVTAGGGTLNYAYAWNPGANTNANATGLLAGNYTVTVTDANGCTATASVAITQPTAVTATISGVTYPLCNGGPGSSIVTPGGGTPNYTYSWAPGANTNANATGLSAGNYTVTVKDANGCVGTASVAITQPIALTITTSFTQASCNLFNGSATATPAGGTSPYVYAWNPSGQTNATATGISAGNYTVTVTDANGCAGTASVTVTQPSAVVASIVTTTGVTCNGGTNGTITSSAAGGTVPYTYSWSTVPVQTNANATGLSAGSYTVTIKDNNGCQSTASATVTEPAAMTVIASGPQTLCLGATGTFTATVAGGTTPYAYLWSNGATTSIASIAPIGPTITVTVTDANGCTATAQTTVNFGPALFVTIAGNSSICSGRTTNLCANTSGGTGGNTYIWTPGGNTTACISVSPTLTTTYTVSVSDNCGITTTASVTVNVNPYPAVGMFADIYQGCAPLCIQFHNTTSNAGGSAQYTWSFGNGDTTQSQNPIYCYTTGGAYNVTLTATSDSGCSSTLKKVNMINVFTRPTAAFTLSPQPTNILSPTIQFTDKSTDNYNLIYWTWNFGDGIDSTSNLENPSHTYQDTGNYCANLIIMDMHGCTDTATNCLVISPAYSLYIPSAFSPNGDARNETFQPKGQYIKSFEMYIFDRWGMKLYHTTDITKGWNGTVSGGSLVAQEDTYVYMINITDSQGTAHHYIGRVTLLK